MKGNKILLGITGSIAAYKSALLVRLLMQRGAEVQVVMTSAARQFITPLTLSTLSKKIVLSNFFEENTGEWHSHIALGQWANLFLIAPASATTLAKCAHGISDNLLVALYLAAKSPVWIAPAMDGDMYFHEATQQNIKTLLARGNRIIYPREGELASGLHGQGRMEEPEEIVSLIEKELSKKKA